MDRISGICFQEPTSQLCRFNSLQNESKNAFIKVSSSVNAYFHADGRSQYATIGKTDGDLKTVRHIIWVGTIHNRDEVIRFLSQSGIAGGTDMCDAQLTLHLYNLVGEDVSTHLIGYYAFAVWDEATQSLFLSRDAIGAERLYYFHTPNLFCWGTEIRQVCFLAGIEPILNEEWMAEALTLAGDGSLVHTKDSAIQGVRSVLPGHNLLLSYGKTPRLTQWWEWKKYRGEKSPKDEDLIEEFRYLLTYSVKNCLGTDPRVIADLSGGMDSSSVVSIACQLAEKGETSVHLRDVFSYYDPNEPRFDDTKYQEAVIKRYGLKQHKASLEGCWFLSGIRDQDVYFDHPTPILLWLNQTKVRWKLLSEKGFTVALSGAGADHIMLFTWMYLFDYVTSGKFATAWKDLTALSTLNTQPMWKVIADNILLPIKHRHRLWEPKISNWLDRDFLQRTNPKARFNDLIRGLREDPLSTQFDILTILHSLNGIFTCKYLADPLGISYRHPFKDRQLMNFALQLPPHLKRQPRQIKYILMKSMKSIVPDFVRLKSGGANFSHFHRQGLVNESDAFNDLARNPILAELGFISQKRWEEEMTRYKLGVFNPYNIFRPSVDMKFALSVEVWLRTCLSQFSDAYSSLKGT